MVRQCSRVCVVLLACVSFIACDSGSGGGSTNADGGSGTDGAAGGGTTPDDDATESVDAADGPSEGDASAGPGDDVGGEPDWEGGPVKETDELELVEVEFWLTNAVNDAADDPVGDALEAGTFVPPTEEGAYLDTWWTVTVPGDNGELGAWFAPMYNAVTTLTVDEPTSLIVRADRVFDVYVDGVPQPGDVYKSRQHRAPFHLDAGEHVVVVRGYGSGNDQGEVQMWTTSDELVFNPADVTFPDLVVGDDETTWIGLPVLNATAEAALDVRAKVVASDDFLASEVKLPSLPSGGSVQVGFKLIPTGVWTESELEVPVTLHVESPSLEWSYEYVYTLKTRAPTDPVRRTRQSKVDRSIQYAGVRLPREYDLAAAGDDTTTYALVLSLHGAGVQGAGQAAAYGAKDWAFLVAPTNRRPFGFDWEEWGRLDALEALEEAMEAFPIDPTRVYVTGHSMGGHGSWQMGTLFPGRFGVVGPSAGWNSFYDYGGSVSVPTYPFSRARASSNTIHHMSNLKQRPIYIIHGDADDNVPISQGYNLRDAALAVGADVQMHVEPGAGHWWDGDLGEGADCVDWPPLFELMADTLLDPMELDFDWMTPSPMVSPSHSFVRVESWITSTADMTVSSVSLDQTVTVTTTNVRSMVIDGAALLDQGITELVVDAVPIELTDGPLEIGPTTGKRAHRNGPFNQVFHQPWCFVYPDASDTPHHKGYAAWLASRWNIYGNGYACALPMSAVDDAIRADNNLVYIGLDSWDLAQLAPELELSFNGSAVTIGGAAFSPGAILSVFPDGDRLAGVMTATVGAEYLLYRYAPFNSRSGMPDFFVWGPQGGAAAGFYDTDWAFDPAQAVGPF